MHALTPRVSPPALPAPRQAAPLEPPSAGPDVVLADETVQFGAIRRADICKARLDEWGLQQIAARISAGERLQAARAVAAEQILPALANEEWLVVEALLLAGYPVPHVLFGPKGAYAILPTGSWSRADIDVLVAIGGELHNLIGETDVASAVLLYSPYTREAPVRQALSAASSATEIWTVGGPVELCGWLAERPGPGMTGDQLALLAEYVREVKARLAAPSAVVRSGRSA
jgi:hypothetical protein